MTTEDTFVFINTVALLGLNLVVILMERQHMIKVANQSLYFLMGQELLLVRLAMMEMEVAPVT